MKITLRQQGDVTILSLKGPLVEEHAPILRKYLEDLLITNHVRIVMDLEGAHYIDTAALAILMNRIVEFQKRKGSIHLIGLNETLQTIFRDASLGECFRIFPTLEEACRSF